MSWQHPHPAVQRAYDKMQTISEERGVDLLECDRCGHEMVIRQTQVTSDPMKNDIRVKCPIDAKGVVDNSYGVDPDGCGWWTRHGIPLDREEYEMEQEERAHNLVDAVSTPVPDHADEQASAEDRLRALGYME